MSLRVNRKNSRIYFYLCLLTVCLAGLLQAATTISSSSNGAHEVRPAANNMAATSYSSVTAPRLRAMEQLLWQRPIDKISTRVLADTADGKPAPIVILLADQADVSLAYEMKDQDARGWFVYNTLTQHAARTQADLQAFLKSQGAEFRSFWAANMIVATADRNLVDQIAARPDVARVDSNQPARWIEDPKIADVRDAPSRVNAPEAVELGVTNVNAPALWALGFTGQNIVVGGLDTGIRWTHNALKPKYRGWNGSVADHNYNWHDSIHSGGGTCGPNTVAPCDDNFHGSHTVGTIVGDDGAGNQVGVAPGAKWIGCRNMDQGNGTPATYTECFQFTIAPTNLAGGSPDATKRPHVLNNSWGCPVSEGCTTGAELETIVNNTQAAGIFVVVSAGNSGSACSTVSDAPAMYSASFSVGAISASTNTLASFSSRGPSLFYNPNVLKPNISAPGVTVRSATNSSDTGYTSANGTSMAGPHVAGVVALLWSARPALLRNIALTKTYLQNSANPAVTVTPAQTCGGTPSTQIPNNSFGYGRVDALAAYNASVPTASPATISGRVTTPDSAPLAGVTMRLSGAATTEAITDNNGDYRFENVNTQSFYAVTPARVNYHFSPDNQAFSLTENKSDAMFTAIPEAVSANPVDTAEYFVRQHYLDFLGREPDASGFNFWSGQISSCGSDTGCVERKRINVSAAYFLSIEFQETGGLVDGLYRASYERQPAFAEFMPDAGSISQNVVVGKAGWEQQLSANKRAFIDAWIQRPAFAQEYGGLSDAAYVDRLISHTGVSFTSNERDALVNALRDGQSRSQVLQQIVEDGRFVSLKRNRAFVMMQYFGYLRRNPDQAGYNFWLGKLDQFGGNFEQAEMVKAFIVSGEYRARFPR